MKRRYKVMPLPLFFQHDKLHWKRCVGEGNRIAPVFNRNGYYLDRQTGLAWLEIDGEAWLYLGRSDFEGSMAYCPGNNYMDEEVYRALEVVCRHRSLSTPAMRFRLYVERNRRELHRTNRGPHGAALRAFHVRKRFLAFCQKRGITIPKSHHH